MNTLAKILGVATLGLIGCNLNAQDKSLSDSRNFSATDYCQYSLEQGLADIDKDSIMDVIIVNYDFNLNGTKDAQAFYTIIDEDSTRYVTSENPSMLILDENEDGIGDRVLLDTNSDGILEEYKKEKKTYSL